MQMNAIGKMVGNLSQLAGLRQFTYTQGVEAGVRAIELYNAAGLRATLVADQCLNVYDFSYRGINLAFQTKNGLMANRLIHPGEGEFPRYWPAGAVYLCGLGNTGPGCTDGGAYHPEHGRIGITPAANISTRQYRREGVHILEVRGDVRESEVCGPCLTLSRRIQMSLEGKELSISDKLTNEEPVDQEFMLLYHINFGYPLLDEGAAFIKAPGKAWPRYGEENGDCGGCPKMPGAADTKDEVVYFHENRADPQGYAYAALVNRNLQLGCYIRYTMASLPVLAQWVNPCTHDYAMGIEPGNSYIMGRSEERKNGTLPVIPAYQSVNCEVTLGILDGAEEISRFQQRLERL